MNAFETLLSLAPRVLFKKVDSTLRGNVVAECLAARRSSGRGLLICPAVPAQGRTLRNGQVYVHGQALAASDYARDARSAPPLEPLPLLFAREGLDIMAMPVGAAQEKPDAIVNAEKDTDLQRLAQCLLEQPQRWLAVGAAGLTEALAAACFPAQAVSTSPAPPLRNVLFVVGSRCDQARRQIACLCEANVALSVIYAMEDDVARQDSARLRLVVPKRRPPVRSTAEQVAQSIAHCVRHLLDAEPGQAPFLFLTGGDTAMAVMARLDIRQVELGGEWAPGVAWGWLDGDRQRPVMTKAGGFGDDGLFVRISQASTTRG